MASPGTASSAASPNSHQPQQQQHQPQPPKKLSDRDFIFHYDRILGEGSFSTVMVGTERKTGVQWAIKSLVIKQLLRDNMQEYAFRERDALNLLNTRPWDPTLLAEEAGSESRRGGAAESEDAVDVASTTHADRPSNHDPTASPYSNASSSTTTTTTASSTPTLRQQHHHSHHPPRPHPFFVRLHASFKTHERLFYVLSYARNGEILDYVKRMGQLPLHVARFYLAEIVSAVHHLHRYGIIHRDLKPENILLGDDMHMLLTDFGSCKILKTTPVVAAGGAAAAAAAGSATAAAAAAANGAAADAASSPTSRVSPSRQPEVASPPRPVYGPVPPPNHPASQQHQRPSRGAASAGRGMRRRATSFVGTAQYVSPEMLQGRPEEKASDLWALGCILYHFIAGSFPFKGTSQYHIFQKIQVHLGENRSDW